MTKSKHSRRRKRRIKNTLSAVLSFFIAISMAAILLSIVIYKGILDYDTLKDQLVRSEYYNTEIENIREEVRTILTATGIEADVTDNIVTDSIIKHDIDKMVDESNAEIIASIDGSFFENECNKVLMNYFEEKKVSEDDVLKQSVCELSKEISDVYVKNMHFEFIAKHHVFAEKYKGIIKYVPLIMSIVLVVCVVLSIFLHRMKYRSVRYVGYGALAGSLITGVVTLVMKSKIVNAIDENAVMYGDVIKSFAGESFNQGIYMSLVGVFFFLLICFAVYYLRKEAI